MLKRLFRKARSTAILSLFFSFYSHGQGGKEFLQWLKEYSPTGYFIISEVEKQEPNFHKQFIQTNPAPMPAVPVHEACHMWNGQFVNNRGGVHGYFIGDNQGLKITETFKAFNSKLIAADIPTSMRTFLTEVYITDGVGGNEVGSMVFGIYGIMDEYAAYGTGLKSALEMGACIKANFNQPQHWNSLANDVHTSVQASSEFRYFILRYILYAKRSYPDIYTKILANQEIREVYTALVRFHEQTLAEWKILLGANGISTTKGNGFELYQTFKTELEKQEYRDVEKNLLIATVGIAPYRSKGPQGLSIRASERSVTLYDAQGRKVTSQGPMGRPGRLLLRLGRAADEQGLETGF